MKLLIAHNRYGVFSGEEAVVERMAKMLTPRGIDVSMLTRTTQQAREQLSGKISAFVSGIYSPSGRRAMREALREHQPDVVNVHNLYPFIGPAALRECRSAGVPVVMTVHNFRLICPTGLMLRDGAPCERCLECHNEWGCVRHNCEHSMLKSLGYATRNAVARLRRDYYDCVDRFACITEFQRTKLIAAGFDPDRIVVIPNCVDVKADSEPKEGDYVAFAGRLSHEKGIDIIVEAARRLPNIKFKLAGILHDSRLIDNLPQNVEYVGCLSPTSIVDFYRGARIMVMASKWYEGFPMTIIEAAQYSKATIGPDHGGFTDIIGDPDLLFTPGDAAQLAQRIDHAYPRGHIYGANARARLESRYATSVVADRWVQLLNQLTTK